jgi:hypothetical protein
VAAIDALSPPTENSPENSLKLSAAVRFVRSREFGHTVKSITMATFSDEEVEKLRDGGNAVAKKIWLARWKNKSFAMPEPLDTSRIRDFMSKGSFFLHVAVMDHSCCRFALHRFNVRSEEMGGERAKEEEKEEEGILFR